MSWNVMPQIKACVICLMFFLFLDEQNNCTFVELCNLEKISTPKQQVNEPKVTVSL